MVDCMTATHTPVSARHGRIAALLLVLHGVLLMWSGYSHSPTFLEVFHLPAGYSHVTLGRFDLARVNPPLVRTVAALPLVLANPHADWRHYDGDPLRRSEYSVGIGFLRANDSRTLWLTTIARWACVPFSVLGGWICFLWAMRLYGTASGLLAVALWVTCPYILGHGALMSPDAHAAALGVTAGYVFWRWLRHPRISSAVLAGIALGAAALAKLTLLVYFPLWLGIWGVCRLRLRRAAFQQGMGEGRQMLLLLFIGILVINIGYGFEGSGRRLGEYRFQSLMLTGWHELGNVPEGGGNRFTGTWLEVLPVPLPANYVQGVDTQKKDFERLPASYLRGHWQRGGWWYFYLYALSVKVPTGTLCLTILAIGGALLCREYRTDWRDEVALGTPIVVMLFVVSCHTGLGLHSRYVLPAIPFVFVWISRTARAFQLGHFRFVCLTLACLAWTVSSSLFCYPHSLSYFNELAGGPRNGYWHLALSDSSWQQDLLYMRRWFDDNSQASPLYIASCGPFDPRLVGFDITLPPFRAKVCSLPEDSSADQ